MFPNDGLILQYIYIYILYIISMYIYIYIHIIQCVYIYMYILICTFLYVNVDIYIYGIEYILCVHMIHQMSRRCDSGPAIRKACWIAIHGSWMPMPSHMFGVKRTWYIIP